jgi:hypothetical protein
MRLEVTALPVADVGAPSTQLERALQGGRGSRGGHDSATGCRTGRLVAWWWLERSVDGRVRAARTAMRRAIAATALPNSSNVGRTPAEPAACQPKHLGELDPDGPALGHVPPAGGRRADPARLKAPLHRQRYQRRGVPTRSDLRSGRNTAASDACAAHAAERPRLPMSVIGTRSSGVYRARAMTGVRSVAAVGQQNPLVSTVTSGRAIRRRIGCEAMPVGWPARYSAPGASFGLG